MYRARENVLVWMDFPWSAARIHLFSNLRTLADALCICANITSKFIGMFGCRFVRPREMYGQYRSQVDDNLRQRLSLHEALPNL